ncbi:N-acetylmuramoyl-L-alanine amidase [Bacillus pretiosus]|uniref:N-acetylmuramoyl-L-alanine amidase n=1 Tax=Bacillus pretiosus TaxID=2983392 RepID=A0ABT3EZG5_9BACI|nr:N-acetylmuramoyl-L-alanine amidase [Bacillus pretiosus]MCW1241944.1 N-acetylmuramoyl-L-alanine amidase [Bacillus pretiosus]
MTNVDVVIDAGHGAHDSGAVGNGLLEKERALTLSHMLNEELRSSGVSTYMTRTSDTFVTLSGRAKMANDRGAKVFISNHLNSAENPSALGYETFVYNRNDKNTNLLQDLIHAEGMKVLSPLGFRDRGKKTKDLAVVRETHMPAVLTENGFISNASDMAHIRKDEVLRKLAQAYAKAICTYLGKNYNGSGNTGGSTGGSTPPTTGGGSNGIGTITISGEGVNLRSGAGTNYPVKRKIAPNTYIVWAMSNGWACVGGDEWVYADPSYTSLKLNGQPNNPTPVVTGVIYINGSNINVRSGAGTNYGIVKKVQKGESYRVWAKEGDWVNVGGNQWIKHDTSYTRFVQD